MGGKHNIRDYILSGVQKLATNAVGEGLILWSLIPVLGDIIAFTHWHQWLILLPPLQCALWKAAKNAEGPKFSGVKVGYSPFILNCLPNLVQHNFANMLLLCGPFKVLGPHFEVLCNF